MKLVFAGTKDGRKYVENLLSRGHKVIVSTATQYGASLYRPHENLIVTSGKMDFDDMMDFIKGNEVSEIIDITHPYAKKVSQNISKCAEALSIPYKVIGRDSYFDKHECDDLVLVKSYAEASDYLEDCKGNVMLTIGSNNLEYFDNIDRDRLYARVLPTSEVLEKCERLGLTPKNIIAVQGPFSYEYNTAMYRQYNIDYLVTKDSGKIGGVEEKVRSAVDCGVKIVMVVRN